MFRYTAIVNYEEKNPLSKKDFWRFLRDYSGGGLSCPNLDDKLLGKAHLIFFESRSLLKTKTLQDRFPDITITELSLTA